MDESSTEEFFARGDAGLYEGGPAHSIHSTVVEIEAAEIPAAVRLARANRRQRYVRIVRRLVTGLGVFCVVAISYRFLLSRNLDAPATVSYSSSPVSVRETALTSRLPDTTEARVERPAAPAEVPSDVSGRGPAEKPPIAAPAKAPEGQNEAEVPSKPAARPVPKPVAARPRTRPRRVYRAKSVRTFRRTARRAAARTRPVEHSVAALPQGHEPPTARFED